MAKILPDVRVEHCTRFRYRYSSCRRCLDQCPQEALSLNEEGVTLDAGRCSGCALCTVSCPTAVFHAANLPVTDIAKTSTNRLTIACRPSEQHGDVEVPCLGVLSASLLTDLGKRGVSITLRGSLHCEQCSHAPHGNRQLYANLEAVARFQALSEPDSWTAPVLDDRAGVKGLNRHGQDRRQLFRGWMARGEVAFDKETPAGLDIPAAAIRAAAHFVPPRRRLAETLWQQTSGPLDDEITALTWAMGYVVASVDNCTGCEACARVCPTGALKVSEAAGDWQLVSKPASCVGCGVCIEACGHHALVLQHGWKNTDTPATVLYTRRRHRCQACGRYFIGLHGDTCPVCSDDEENFSAIFG